MANNATPLLTQGITAQVDIAVNLPVTKDGAIAAAGATCIGFSTSAALAGGRCPVAIQGSAIAQAGAAIVLGDNLQVGANGLLVPQSNGSIVGRAMNSASGIGDNVEVLIAPYGNITAKFNDATMGIDALVVEGHSLPFNLYPSNNIGIPGNFGFGLGICPALPAGYLPLPGYTDILSQNYGNYQYSDGSIMVWVPAFYMRLGHTSNPTFATYGVNSIDIKPLSYFANEAAANAVAYYLHRAFVNAGANQLGFWRDKYDCSQNGAIASSIANAMPMVSGPAAGQVGFVGCTANGQTPANAYYGALQAAKSRGNKFFSESVFIADALCRISEAHAQAAFSTAACAWFDPAGVRNYPKGNDNNALKSEADVTLNSTGAVTWTTAGASSYAPFALTGSAVPFARSTHNGQACGIADVAGNIYKVNPGMTCIAAGKTITAATQANPVALTITGHGYTTGDVLLVTGIVGMTQLNDRMYTCTAVDANTITLDGINSTGYTAYGSAGSTTKGTFYLLKPSVDIATVTSGASTAADHWGATGVAAQFDAVTPNFATGSANNAVGQRYGNGANAVFDWSTSAGRVLAMAGMPAAAGMSAAGSNLMGGDYYYQYIRDQLCVFSRGYWSDGSNAGSRLRALSNFRSDAYNYVGFACASYL